MPTPGRTLVAILGSIVFATVVYASTGDRNPTFQQCLKGCRITYCDPSQPPLPAYLRAFGWTCEDDCRYECGHAFTDMIRTGSRYHQFYGKWAFYRLGPIQEPFSVLMSIGNFWAHWQGFKEVRRRVSGDNLMKRWLLALAVIQMNTWIWSAVFHTRDVPITERLDYFSATITIASSLLFTIARTMLLQTPNKTSRLLLPASVGVIFLVGSHFNYLLSFPLGQFPYGYHTKFNVILGMIHNLLWILWSLRFVVRFPKMHIGSRYTLEYPKPYPPRNPLDRPRQKDGMTPLALVIVMTAAMSLELLDFAPVARVVDAHSLWHAATIPIALGWWTFMCNDAVEFEGSIMGKPATIVDEVAPLLNGPGGRQPVSHPEPVIPPAKTPDYIQIAAASGSNSRPRGSIVKEDRQD